MSNIHPVVDDTDSDDKMGWWVENLREEEESMVKPNDLQLLQLSCSIRRRGVNPQPVQQVDAHTQHVDTREGFEHTCQLLSACQSCNS